MIRKYVTEDRSASGIDNPCPETRREDLTLQDMEHLTDFTAEEFDAIADMDVGQVTSIGNPAWLYIFRMK